ncbi:DUF397 domain-containing protein [Fodinicola feengrottensis]|uniref:DUF397 domain-containing protein n=1 Tax=Fodinicola feengrottensis TaxID=435914 RepID=UPI0031D3065F
MLAPTWRKSRRSQSDNNCVEVADVPRILLVRDSKLGEQSPHLGFDPARWRTFVTAVKVDGFTA